MVTFTEERCIAPAFETEAIGYLPELFRTALRLTGHMQEAEDLLQETMLKAFRFSHTYQPGTDLRAWLFRILKTSAINRYRKNAASPLPSPLPDGEEFSLAHQIRDFTGQEHSQGVEEQVLNNALDDAVSQALNILPPSYRMAVVLADIHELSYKEIAETLHIPIGTVMSRIARGRRQLQTLLWQYARERGYAHSPLRTQKRGKENSE